MGEWTSTSFPQHALFPELQQASQTIVGVLGGGVDDSTASETLILQRFKLKALWDRYEQTSMSRVPLDEYTPRAEPLVSSARDSALKRYANDCCCAWDSLGALLLIGKPLQRLLRFSPLVAPLHPPADRLYVYDLLAPPSVPGMMLMETGVEILGIESYESTWLLASVKSTDPPPVCRALVTVCRNDNKDIVFFIAHLQHKTPLVHM